MSSQRVHWKSIDDRETGAWTAVEYQFTDDVLSVIVSCFNRIMIPNRVGASKCFQLKQPREFMMSNADVRIRLKVELLKLLNLFLAPRECNPEPWRAMQFGSLGMASWLTPSRIGGIWLRLVTLTAKRIVLSGWNVISLWIARLL